MKSKLSRSGRRIGVILNYLCLILLVVFYYTGKGIGWSNLILAGIGSALIMVVLSFIKVHVVTDLWKLVHAKIERLDERQIQVTHKSLRISYSIFSVICLVVLFYASMTGGGGIDIVAVASLIYFAHTLPSSVIAWTEKEV